MTTLREAIEEAARTLSAAGISDPRAEARRLAALALDLSGPPSLAETDSVLGFEHLSKIQRLAARRADHEPFAYIAGVREFWSLPFRVTRATLIPRPDTETVVEAVLARLRSRRDEALRVLDLGTGTGCILLALLSELPRATGLGVDASEAALVIAGDNARALGLASRAAFQHGDWTRGLSGPFDIVVSNPPYIADADVRTLEPDIVRFEPLTALEGGADGLACYRALAAGVPSLLAPNATLALEVGLGQAEAVVGLLRGHGLDILEVRSDLGGIPRCVVATGPGN